MDPLDFPLHRNFEKLVGEGGLPEVAKTGGLAKEDFVSLFESQITSRHLDFEARRLKEKSQSFYTIGSSGHEGNAALGFVFPYTDMAFLHYRSGAFFIERSKQVMGLDAIGDILLSLVASKSDPISEGRHKVFGSKKLNIPPQTSTIASHLPKALGAALSIRRAKELALESPLLPSSLVLVNFGDASFNHASCQTTLNAAHWIEHNNYPLPLLFVCEDNGIGISCPTPDRWVETSMAARSGIRYFKADGLNLFDIVEKARAAEAYVRKKRKPAFLHMKCVRLMGHAGSDIETLYRSKSSILSSEAKDPLLVTASLALKHGFLRKEEILNLYKKVEQEIKSKLGGVLSTPKLSRKEEVTASLFAENKKKLEETSFSKARREELRGFTQLKREQKRNLSQSLNLALFDLLFQYKNIVLLGEDVGPKGGVYHVTSGLQKAFGARRVFDTILDETTILGSAIGLAHNNFLPIPEIQFLAYLHNAEDQIRGEACTLSFFSSGQYTNPMVLRLPSLAYQKGFGGHFHNDNSLAVLRDIPSLIMVCPSNPEEAPGLLRSAVKLAWEKGCVVVFVEPIALYMTKDLHEEGDGLWLAHYEEQKTIPLGEVKVVGDSKELAIVSYGNGYYLSRKAAKILEDKYGLSVKVIDMRWLKPLPMEALIFELEALKRILVLDECRQTGSLSEEIVTRLYESGRIKGQISRLTGEDSFIPLGDAAYHMLPCVEDIVRWGCEAMSS